MGLNLQATLGLDGAGFERGMDRATEKARGFAEGIKGFVIGAIGIGTVEQAISKTVETADELVNASKRLGIGIENLQTLRRAAKDAGLEFEGLEKAFERIDVARAKALAGGQENQVFRNAFSRLGVSAEQLRNTSAANLFTGPLSRAAGTMSQENLGPLLRDLGLKDFGALIPVLKTDFAELGAELKNTGAIMDADTAVKLKHLGEGFSLLGQIITSQVGPALLKFAEWAYGAILKAGGTVAKVGAQVGGALGAGGIEGTAKLLAAHIVGFSASLYSGSPKIGAGIGEALQKKLGVDNVMAAAQKAGKEAEKPWEEADKAFQKRLEEWAKEANALNNQKPQTFQPDINRVNAAKTLEAPTDSLVRVGNFLGGSQNAISNLSTLQREANGHLKQIVKNTGGANLLNYGQGPIRSAPKSPLQVPTLFGSYIPEHG